MRPVRPMCRLRPRRGTGATRVVCRPTNRFDPTSPFGGYKESGFGREGGRHGLEAYCAQ